MKVVLRRVYHKPEVVLVGDSSDDFKSFLESVFNGRDVSVLYHGGTALIVTQAAKKYIEKRTPLERLSTAGRPKTHVVVVGVDTDDPATWHYIDAPDIDHWITVLCQGGRSVDSLSLPR